MSTPRSAFCPLPSCPALPLSKRLALCAHAQRVELLSPVVSRHRAADQQRVRDNEASLRAASQFRRPLALHVWQSHERFDNSELLPDDRLKHRRRARSKSAFPPAASCSSGHQAITRGRRLTEGESRQLCYFRRAALVGTLCPVSAMQRARRTGDTDGQIRRSPS